MQVHHHGSFSVASCAQACGGARMMMLKGGHSCHCGETVFAPAGSNVSRASCGRPCSDSEGGAGEDAVGALPCGSARVAAVYDLAPPRRHHTATSHPHSHVHGHSTNSHDTPGAVVSTPAAATDSAHASSEGHLEHARPAAVRTTRAGAEGPLATPAFVECFHETPHHELEGWMQVHHHGSFSVASCAQACGGARMMMLKGGHSCHCGETVFAPAGSNVSRASCGRPCSDSEGGPGEDELGVLPCGSARIAAVYDLKPRASAPAHGGGGRSRRHAHRHFEGAASRMRVSMVAAEENYDPQPFVRGRTASAPTMTLAFLFMAAFGLLGLLVWAVLRGMRRVRRDGHRAGGSAGAAVSLGPGAATVQGEPPACDRCTARSDSEALRWKAPSITML